MPFVFKVRSKTGMVAEELNKGITQGILGYMQMKKLNADIAAQEDAAAYRKKADERAEDANIRAEESQGFAREKQGEWQEGADLRKQTAEMQFRADELADKTAPTPAEVIEARELGIQLKRAQAAEAKFTTEQREVTAEQWGDHKETAISALEGLGVTLTHEQRESITGIAWSTASEKLLYAQLASATQEWGLGKQEEFLQEIDTWGDVDPDTGEPTSPFSGVEHIGAMAVARMDPANAQSVMAIRMALDTLKGKEVTRRAALDWANDPAQIAILNEKTRATPGAYSGYTPEALRIMNVKPGQPTYQQNQYAAQWYKYKDQLKQGARVAADGSIEYSEDYEYTFRAMEAHLKLNAGDPGTSNGNGTGGGGGGGGDGSLATADLTPKTVADDEGTATIEPRATTPIGGEQYTSTSDTRRYMKDKTDLALNTGIHAPEGSRLANAFKDTVLEDYEPGEPLNELQAAVGVLSHIKNVATRDPDAAMEIGSPEGVYNELKRYKLSHLVEDENGEFQPELLNELILSAKHYTRSKDWEEIGGKRPADAPSRGGGFSPLDLMVPPGYRK